MNYEAFLRRIPKAELHCHLEGAVRADTLADLARKHEIRLPSDDTSKLYEYETIYDFLKIYGLVCEALKERDDFARAAYESLEDGVTLGNLRYREMFWNPQNHFDFDVAYETQVDGLIEGMTAAEADRACAAGCSPPSIVRSLRPRPSRWWRRSSSTAGTK